MNDTDEVGLHVACEQLFIIQNPSVSLSALVAVELLLLA